MRGKTDPDWRELVQHWKQTQANLREKLIVEPLASLPRFVAGVDAAYAPDRTTAYAAAVVFDRIEKRTVEVVTATCTIDVPYIPGFLSFREGPAIIAALGQLKHPFGVICFDGQGYAHPRRCGLASHVAITLDLPGIGVAKSRFIGEFAEPGETAGSASPLMDAGEQIGLVIRTRDRTQPVFVSVGHRITLESAKDLVLACCTKYRIPEPTRQADIEVENFKRKSMSKMR